jgi:DHA2 family multidrug resistance protein
MILLSVPLVAIIHELCRKLDVRLICCLNVLGFAATMFWIGQFDKNGYFDSIALPMRFFGLSLAAFFTPLSALAIHGLPASRLIRAAEELTLLRTCAGAFGIALQAVVIFRRTPFHQLDLAVCLARSFVSILGQAACVGIFGEYGAKSNGAPHSPTGDLAGPQ